MVTLLTIIVYYLEEFHTHPFLKYLNLDLLFSHIFEKLITDKKILISDGFDIMYNTNIFSKYLY